MIAAFLSFLGFINAEEKNESINYGTTLYIGEGYDSISCPNNLTYFDVIKVNELYKVSLKDNIQDLPSTVSEKLVCEYLKKSDNSNITSTKSNVTYTISYNVADRDDYYRFTLTKTNFNSTPSRELANPGELGDIKRIESFEVISGGEYVDVTCPNGGSSCVIQLKKDFYTDSQREFLATLKYIDVNGANVTMHLVGTLRGKGTFELIPGVYGTCNFGSEWTQKNSAYVIDYNGGNITLPTCSSEGSADQAVEFYGWTSKTNFGTASNICGNGDMYYAGESFNPDEKGIYRLYSCYVRKSGIVIHTNGAVVNPDKNNWLAMGKDSYFIFGDDKVKLPEIVKIPAIYGADAKFLGWQLNGTTTVLQPLTEVEADRSSYHAVFESTSSYDSSKDYDFNYIYEGDTQVYSLSGVTFDGCISSNSSFVTTSFTSGQCMITAVKSSEDEIVEIKASSGEKSYTLKLKVLKKDSKKTGSSSSSSTHYNEPFVVSFEYLVAGDQHDGNTEEPEVTQPTDPGKEIKKTNTADITLTSKDSFCDKFYVNRTTPLADGENRIIATSTIKNSPFNMGMPKFIAKSTCNDLKTYDTICLDPSGTPPKSTDDGATSDGILYYKKIK